jgi:hypothetical protein
MFEKFEIGDGGFEIVKKENIHISENGLSEIALFTGNTTLIIKDRWLAASRRGSTIGDAGDASPPTGLTKKLCNP